MMKTYYIQGHTSEGNVHLLNQFWEHHDIWFLKGASMVLRHQVLFKLEQHLNDKQMSAEKFVHPNDGKLIDGLLLTGKKLLILADNGPLYPASRYPGLATGTLDLNDCLNFAEVQQNASKIAERIAEADGERHCAYACFRKGREIHEKKEAVYLSALDFNKADETADEIILKWVVPGAEKEAEPLISRRFFGAATAFGPKNGIEEITREISHRIIIKGRSGSGKSTLMRKIGEAAEERRLSVKYFPCALSPNSLDMLLIPALDLAVVDGTAPHIVHPSRRGDQVVDMFERCMNPAVETTNKSRLAALSKEYKEVMQRGTKHLQRVNELEYLLHECYASGIDAEKQRQLEQQLAELAS